MILVAAVLGLPLLTALACAIAPRWSPRAGVAGSVLALAAALGLAAEGFSEPPRRGLDGALYLDALSALIVAIVALVAALATIGSASYLRNEVAQGHLRPERVHWFHIWFQLSVLAMLAVPLLNNVGAMWVAIEGTTLTTALLVAFLGRGRDLEAAWKYLMLCTVGIAFALFGVVLTFYAASHGTDPGSGLEWDRLRAGAAALDPRLMRLAFVLVLVGFGTKAGLAPMHTWLPDAHGQGPTPVSALLSGALLPCALYGVLRFHLLAAGAVGTTFSSDLLIGIGVLSMLVAVPFVLVQHDLKRLLAYSSVEHMGIVALAVGIGSPLALFAAAFHLFNHALGKSALFFAAGAIGQRYGTLRLARLRGAIDVARAPALGLVLATLAISGLPPFGTFASELGIARAGLAGRPAAIAGVAALFVATVLVFGGMLFHVLQVVLRDPPRNTRPTSSGPVWLLFGAPVAVLLFVGVWLPPVLSGPFAAVARVLEVMAP
ncbi:MAG TPA: proton-conducting transporter membrane subunit [Candidatus Limnocylindria bacterium]|nr:proton-conducting transporter membrane subunit [Candidatus Limnocylindria bacterium]